MWMASLVITIPPILAIMRSLLVVFSLHISPLQLHDPRIRSGFHSCGSRARDGRRPPRVHKHHDDEYDRVCLITLDVNSTWRDILSQSWILRPVPEYKPMAHFLLGMWDMPAYPQLSNLSQRRANRDDSKHWTSVKNSASFFISRSRSRASTGQKASTLANLHRHSLT
jgi:hypothetical protein